MLKFFISIKSYVKDLHRPAHSTKFIDGDAKMRERDIEQQLVKAVKKTGGLCLKFISPSMNGVPDRLVLMPNGRAAFVELKSTGKKMRALQKRRKEQLEGLGFPVFCIDSAEQIGGVIVDLFST